MDALRAEVLHMLADREKYGGSSGFMSKLTRNTSDEQSRTFWDSVDKGAPEIASAPQWMKAGIKINEQHFEMFAVQQASTESAPEAPGGKKT